MTYAAQRDALARTPQELLVVGVRECMNAYAATVPELLQYTEQIDNAAWTKTSVTVTANNATAPDGTATADTCVFNANNDAIDQVATGTAVTSKAFTMSLWLRVPSGSSTISIRVRNVADTQGTTKQVTVTTTWTRFYVHKLFTALPVDDVQARLIRLAGDTINGDIEVWGWNLTQNRNAVNMESPFPYVKRESTAVNASTCSMSDQGDGYRCYYSRPTCQDPDNFNAGHTWEDTARGRGIREYRFCRKDAPLPLSGTETLPYLVSAPQAAQELDAEKAVTVNDRVTFEFEDDAGPGLWNPRQSSEGMLVNTATGRGTFFRRAFGSIYRNYANPEGYLKRYHGFVETGMTESDFQSRGRYLIRNFETQDRKVMLVCGDRLRLTRKDIPAKISEDNTLQRRLSSSDTTAYVRDASEFGPVADNAASASPDYVVTIQIANEKMNVTGIDLSANTLTITRGRWGTTADSHSRSAVITAVAEFGTERTDTTLTPLGKNPIDIIIELYRYAGLSAAEVDTTTLESERDYWLPSTIDADAGTYYGALLRRSLTEVTDVETLSREIRKLTMLWLWVNDAQMLTGRYFAPPRPSSTITTITDDANLIAGSISVDDNDESRVSRVLVAYHLPVGESADTAEDFEKIRIELDVDSEEREFYGDRRLDAVLSQWLQPVTASGISTESEIAKYFTQRVLSRFRYGARRLTASLEIKDDDIEVADVVRVNTSHIQDADGDNLNAEMHVTKKKRVGGGRVELEFLDTGRNKRPGFYTDAGYPVYGSATDDQKRRAFYADTRGNVGSPSVPGYVYQ
jgi:hypothetical protein